MLSDLYESRHVARLAVLHLFAQLHRQLDVVLPRRRGHGATMRCDTMRRVARQAGDGEKTIDEKSQKPREECV